MASENMIVPKSMIENILKRLNSIDNRSKNESLVNDLIPEGEAARLLEIERETLQKKVRDGYIKPDFYVVGLGGKRFFFKSKLVGI